MASGKDNAITLPEIDHIRDHCMKLLSCTAHLRQNEKARGAHAHAEELFPSLRKLFISSLMYGKTLICVAGLQGAGKTTLMKNFYGLDNRYLNPSLARGERLPVLITEEDGITEPYARTIRVEEDPKDGYVRKEVTLSEAEFASAVKGTDDRVMYLELCVPVQHTNGQASFLLLPGFEKGKSRWNDLIEFSINSSDAAVFVFNETSFSNADVADCIDWVKGRFGSNLIYAITGSDSSSDDNEAVKKTCVAQLDIPTSEANRVVCTGSYAEKSKNEAWIAAFKDALRDHAHREIQQLEKNNQHLYREVDGIIENLHQIHGILTLAEGDVQNEERHDDRLLQAFDEAAKKQRKRIVDALNKQLDAAKAKSAQKLRDEFQHANKLKLLPQLFVRNEIKQYNETLRLVQESLEGESGSLPAEHLRLALYDSLVALDQPEVNTNVGRLLSSDIQMDAVGRYRLTCGETLQAVANDVQALLVDPRGRQSDAPLQCNSERLLMSSMAELSTYYFAQAAHDELAVSAGMGTYKPAKIDMVSQHMLDSAKSTISFAGIIASMTTADILDDKSVNNVAKIAAAFKMPTWVAGIGGAALIGGGAALAIARDLNQMQREDLRSALLAMEGYYDAFKLDALKKYDDYIERIRDRIEDNRHAARQIGSETIYIFNAQRQVLSALNLLEPISSRARKDALNPFRLG